MTEEREARRYAVQLRLRYALASDFVREYASNLSAGGLFMRGVTEYERLTDVIVEIELPGTKAWRVQARIVHVIDQASASLSGKEAGSGMEIHTAPPGFQGALRAYLETLGRRSGRVVFAGDEDMREALAGAGYEAQLAPPPRSLEEAIQGLEGKALALVVTETWAAAYSRIPGAKEIVHTYKSLHDLDSVLTQLDATMEGRAPPRQAPAQPRPTQVHHGEPIVGIDLGTSFTSVAVVMGNRIVPLMDKPSRHAIASAVSFPSENEIVLGQAARERLLSDAEHTIVSPKRLLGRQFRDREVQGLLFQVPYQTHEGPDGSVLVTMWGEPYAIPQICSYLLRRARQLAEEELGQRVTRAVFTAPVTFEEPQMRALRRAAKLAQIEILEVIDEPSAAALANRGAPNFGGKIAIYDFGGGTFDVSLVEVAGSHFEVLATEGDAWLGGDDFDDVLTNAVADSLWKRTNVDVRNLAVELQQLNFAAERTKRLLSREEQAPLVIPNYLRTPTGMSDLRVTVSRQNFEQISEEVVDRSMDVFRYALSEAELESSDLSSIFLSGGTTYIPSVRQALVDQFGVPIHTGVPPEHAPAMGACLYAAQLLRRQ